MDRILGVKFRDKPLMTALRVYLWKMSTDRVNARFLNEVGFIAF